MEKNFITLVQQAGVVGAGGAGFPSHVKMNAKAEYVIINGAECEPLLRVDQQLIAIEAEKLLKSLQLIVDNVSAKEGIIALKKKYHAAQEALEKIIINYPQLHIHLLDNFYPAGDEQVIVYEVTGRVVPEGGIPLNVGVIVTNVETAFNIYCAYYNEKPVTEKYVTITGAVKEKKTVKVPLGISVKEMIDLAGGTTIDEYVVINGGPMMGKLISIDAPITKTVKGLIVLPKNHSLILSYEKSLHQMLKEAKAACMHCSLCSEICPRGMLNHRIEPHKLMRIASYGSVCETKSSPLNAFLCCGCRLCEYACVMNLQPWKLNNYLKTEFSKNGIKNILKNTPQNASAFREYKKFPVKKLIARLGLQEYDLPAPMQEIETKFQKVCISMQQHVGVIAKPIVQIGDKVRKGDLIGKIPENALGSPIHASISGIVTNVTNDIITIEAV